MTKITIYLKFIFLSLLISVHSINAQTGSEINKTTLIEQALTDIVNDGKAPGMIAAIISSDGVEVIASAGVRKQGSGKKLTISDKVHLGSCGKAMTCALMATFIEEGKLDWNTRLLEVIPELKNHIHPDFFSTTLWQLLTHTAGFPDLWTHNKTLTKEKRLSIIKKDLRSSSKFKPGSFHYSNLGYVTAAAMAERITGKYWEDLMQERIFKPLGMTSTGFGNPGTSKKADQPWGHRKSGRRWIPDQSSCSEVLGPAGRIHCNIEDWAKFLSLQLAKSNPILDSTSINKLKEPPIGFYAGGWGVAKAEWAKGKTLSHCGSNGIWYSSVLVAPNLNKAYIVVTNSRDFGVTKDLIAEMTNKLIIMDLETIE